MEPTQLLKESSAWVDANLSTVKLMEIECKKMRADNHIPRVKYVAEVMRGRGHGVSNSAIAFIARIIEHNTGIKTYTTRSKIDNLLTDSFWERWDEIH